MKEIDLGYDPVGSWKNFNPFVRIYVYPKGGISYVVKGGLAACKDYVKKQGKLALMHVYRYQKGKGREKLEFNIPATIVYTTIRLFRSRTYLGALESKHWLLVVCKEHEIVFKKRFRRPPRGWPSCLKPIL